MKTKENINNIKEAIEKSEKISIVTHLNPDGDAIGSILALYHFLQDQVKKNVYLFVPDSFPKFLQWMPGADNVIVCDQNIAESSKLLEKSDAIFCLDFNNTSRIKCMKDSVLNNTCPKILIDHHPEPENFAQIVISETKVSSTAELIYNTINQLGGTITKDIATCLFTGIMTDTGGFSHNSSQPDTYRIVSDLLQTGIDKNEVFDKIYNNYSADRMRLMGYCLHEKMKVFPELRTAYISLSKEELDRFNFSIGDTEGFVNLPLSVEGVIFSAFLMERDGMVKTSFRSKGKFAVNEFSRSHFNGGGHTNAAGGESYETLEKTVEKFVSLLPEYKEKIYQA